MKDMISISKDDVQTTAQVLLDKKGRDVVLLEISAVAAYTDYFLIASGRSTTQVKALASAVEEHLRSRGFPPLHIEGYTEGRWVLLDFDELIVHVFLEEARHFYDLERLWRDVPRTDFADPTPPPRLPRRDAH